ncbi:MAG: L-2-amino-thiazoline-4-carboxylic acid hydrolase [Gemmatimonadetes bacterium]|nr:L-2-amino-thiazoline-4-carboxylic acid hydrolase [Gemmatimonadota bacterium]NNM07365.1 L-2-amino-thiazoline-4-carboxylic acid hydrolase [Gemmatimonadota bacterium]
MDSKKSAPSLSHLSCREAQAPLVSALIKGFSRARGEEEALTIARDVIWEDAIRSGRSLAEVYSGTSLEALLQVVQEVWAVDGTMEITNVELTRETLCFDVTACEYAEMYERLGLRKMGCLLSCDRDFPFMEGFNPDIQLQRTQTIMEGADHCDFRYRKRLPPTTTG